MFTRKSKIDIWKENKFLHGGETRTGKKYLLITFKDDVI